MNQEQKKQISTIIKPILKKYKLKGTLSVKHYSTICLTLSAGEIDFFKHLTDRANNFGAYDYIDVNPYSIDKHFSGIAQQALTELNNALYSNGYYDNSEPMTDYFDVAYYVSLMIGRDEKPYVHIKH
jgi:hypothetical protein